MEETPRAQGAYNPHPCNEHEADGALGTQGARNPRACLDPSCYLVIGPENCARRPFAHVLRQALDAGFTCVQLRSKESSARECMELLELAARTIEQTGAQKRVTLLMNDRVDVALAARMAGVKVDGVHVGQSDVPPDACRRLLGPQAVVGLSAHAPQIAAYLQGHANAAQTVDYFGVGPLHPTNSKQDLEKDEGGHVITRTLDEIATLAASSPLPLVVGGGVTAADLPALKAAGARGFFVISAVCGADDPAAAARQLVNAWR